MTFTTQVHDVATVAAESTVKYVEGVGVRGWVTITAQTASGKANFTMFCADKAVAVAIADAINAANASLAVQKSHEDRLSAAGIQEYRNLVTEIA